MKMAEIAVMRMLRPFKLRREVEKNSECEKRILALRVGGRA